MTSPGLLTDRYELTMLSAALADGTAHLQCTFEVYARRLPLGRRYGVVAGTGRVLDAIERFSFSGDEIEWLETVVLSIMNHDTARRAAVASLQESSPGARPITSAPTPRGPSGGREKGKKLPTSAPTPRDPFRWAGLAGGRVRGGGGPG
jgi:hypothetical protein